MSLQQRLMQSIKDYENFPIQGITFKDINPILRDPELFNELLNVMAQSPLLTKSDAIIAVDARGFIFGACIANKLKKPLVLARKPGKLPGQLIEENYDLEYGSNGLSIQCEALAKYKKFVIVDDLLATGGTVESIYKILNSNKKIVLGLLVLIELIKLEGRKRLSFEVDSILKL
tara:strand:- start:3173 stop:3694 length:522 start_codon:yes stop_codon:yes gene_type:complete